MDRGVRKAAGISFRCGVKAPPRSADGLPTPTELREMSKRLSASNRRGRCGRPGRTDAPEYWEHVLAKLKATAKRGRGMRFLSRDELDAVLLHLGGEGNGYGKTSPGRTGGDGKAERKRTPRRRRSQPWGIMP